MNFFAESEIIEIVSASNPTTLQNPTKSFIYAIKLTFFKNF